MLPYSQWCHPGPEHRGDLSGATPPPSAHAPIGCWDPHWSQRYSESVWRDRRTCGCQGGIIERADSGEGEERQKRHTHTHTHTHNPESPSPTLHIHTILQPVTVTREGCLKCESDASLWGKTCITQHAGVAGISVRQTARSSCVGGKKDAAEERTRRRISTWVCWGSHRSWCQLDSGRQPLQCENSPLTRSRKTLQFVEN